MSKGNTFINDFLKLVFNATAIANIADNAATSPLTNLYVALHTASPTASGAQNNFEAAYTGYARATVARTTGGWTAASAQSTSPAATIAFAAATAGSETETHFSVQTTASGTAGKIICFGTITPNIPVSNGTTPQLTTATTITET
jgi:hypothetical protein